MTSGAPANWPVDFYRGNITWLPERTIFLTRHGSHAYGTALPTSDLDVKGIAIAPREYYLGFEKSFEQAESKDPDLVIYDVRKFFRLAADCNPNIIELLFTDESDWLIGRGQWVLGGVGPWLRIFEKRHLFLSQRARHTFSGYAFAQLKRIQSHRAWLLNPPAKKPARADFGLRDGEATIGKDQLGVIEAEIRRIEDKLGGAGHTRDKVDSAGEAVVTAAAVHLNLSLNLIPVILAERRYAGACRNWASYQTWKAQRNPARAELEARFGYDTKHAMHLVRLLRMAREILADGKVLVRRPDAAELLEVRAGAWTYDELMAYATKAEADLAEIAERSPLQREPDRRALDRLLVDVISAAL